MLLYTCDSYDLPHGRKVCYCARTTRHDRSARARSPHVDTFAHVCPVHGRQITKPARRSLYYTLRIMALHAALSLNHTKSNCSPTAYHDLPERMTTERRDGTYCNERLYVINISPMSLFVTIWGVNYLFSLTFKFNRSIVRSRCFAFRRQQTSKLLSQWRVNWSTFGNEIL